MNTGVFVFVGTSRTEESKQGKEVLQQFITDICKQKTVLRWFVTEIRRKI